jgi:hypothetical protein
MCFKFHKAEEWLDSYYPRFKDKKSGKAVKGLLPITYLVQGNLRNNLNQLSLTVYIYIYIYIYIFWPLIIIQIIRAKCLLFPIMTSCSMALILTDNSGSLSFLCFLFVFETGSCCIAQLTSNSWSSCLSLPSAAVYHHTLPTVHFLVVSVFLFPPKSHLTTGGSLSIRVYPCAGTHLHFNI